MSDKKQKPPKKKFSLVKAFAQAAFCFLACTSTAYAGWFGGFYAGRGEPLTTGERQAVTEVFGDQVNTSAVRKHFREESHPTHFRTHTIGMVLPPSSHIDFYGQQWRSSDYSHDSTARYALFMHEITHVYQGQHLAFPLHDFHRYDYTLTPQSRFRDFGPEQQADMVENYAVRWLHPGNANAHGTPADTLLANVVESQFPQARITRENLDHARHRPQAPQGPKTA